MPTHTDIQLVVMSGQSALERWYPTCRPAHISPYKRALHDFAASRIGIDKPIRLLEFGVHEGRSLRYFCNIFPHPESQFFGFDSFLGLPSSWGGLEQGHFSTGGQIPDIGDPRASCVSGWFQNSVREFLPALVFETPRMPTLVHFDADLWSSTLFLLTSLWWFLPEYWFIFDEFNGDEMAAMWEFVRSFPVEVEFFSEVRGTGGKPAQVFGRLQATQMVLDGIG
jgi:hypothetical protein